MTSSRTGEAGSLKGLETLYQLGAVGNLTDGELLEGFVKGRGAGEAAEAGFTALVDRHGPMVLRVCRQILGETHDAEDAFQATFLIVVRKAGSVRKCDSVASWLHGIARRVAHRARSNRSRRFEYERRSAEMSARTESRPAEEPERWPELHEELARLPEKYREPLVLCYLEGLTTDEASRRLGCPQGTILSRLSRARDRLRDPLTRRGLAAPAGLIAGGSSADIVPAALSHSVVQSAVRLAAGGAATTIVSASVAGLARGVLRTMILTKLGITAAAVAAAAALAAGAGRCGNRGRPPTPRRRPKRPRGPLPLHRPWSQTSTRFGRCWRPASCQTASRGPMSAPTGAWKRSISSRRKPRPTTSGSGRGRAPTPTRRESASAVRRCLPTSRMACRSRIRARSCRSSTSAWTSPSTWPPAASIATIAIGSMTFHKPDTNEVVDIPNVGVIDTRSIVTRDRYIYFWPDQQATYAYLDHLPEARNKRMARRGNMRRMGSHFGDMMDPRAFFTFDTGNKTWANLELIAGALRGKNGEKNRRMAEERFSLAQADGPDGRWYCHQQWFGAGKGSSMWATAFWSPRAGFNPVGYVTADEKPDGKVSTRVEWEWTVIDGIHVPSRIKEEGYEVPGGPPSRERESKLSDCILNRPLDPHQFDHAGLGLADGDLIVDEVERVGYIIKDGEPVKLGDFIDPDRR